MVAVQAAILIRPSIYLEQLQHQQNLPSPGSHSSVYSSSRLVPSVTGAFCCIMQVGQRALAKWGSRYYETVLVEDKGASCVVMHTTYGRWEVGRNEVAVFLDSLDVEHRNIDPERADPSDVVDIMAGSVTVVGQDAELNGHDFDVEATSLSHLARITEAHRIAPPPIARRSEGEVTEILNSLRLRFFDSASNRIPKQS